MTAMVLLSGWGIDARIWQPLAPYWPAGMEVHAPDWPGYGERRAESHPASLPELASLMRDALPADAIWVGWSLGGLLAGALLAHLPPPRALVLIGTAARFCQAGGVSATELDTFRRAFERQPQATWQHFLRWQLQGEPTPRTAHRRLLDLIGPRPSASLHTLEAGLEQLAGIDLTLQFATPPCPIRRVAGAHDGLLGEEARHSADLVLADTGHCPMLSCPTALAAYLTQLRKEVAADDKHEAAI
ncbi:MULTISPECIES: alpha/beta fold hydrolase [Halomonadaceae]|uniref:Alpha/beta fold hydrolase n=1 Tax=Billgrantia aerodenitrificans TaxID=2733483 RepID=A0ABS9APA5_9GAMM|nr:MULTISPECIES: alpha/beta fold hydrolase [Halomonas]MCE8023690.1 alpha/beta fold hydrolase [Halomonas aerodenitrificans]